MSKNKTEQTCECGDTSCDNKEGSWEEGVADTFDRAFDLIAELTAKGEKPVALCVFAVGDKGHLVFETAGVGPAALTEMILSEACLQVADSLEERAMKTPGFKDMMAKLDTISKEKS